jgi:hypothetical protein
METKVLEKGQYAIFQVKFDCWEYGSDEKYLLFRGDELIAAHEKTFDMGEMYSSFTMRNRMERTIDFENEKVFVRRDTVRNSVKKWINKEFEEETFSSGLRDEAKQYLEDPRERYSLEKGEESYGLYRYPRVGKLSAVLVSHKYLHGELDIELLDAYALQEIKDPSNYKSKGIPKDAVFAYSTWFAGGGDLLYGKLNDGVLQIYGSHEDESLREIPPYELLLEVDPDLLLPAPDHYIVFDPVTKGKNKLMLAFDDEDKALYAKYEGQSRHIELKLKEDKSEGNKTIRVYTELIHGIPHGRYIHTHIGIADYVVYIGENGKEVKFSINHELTAPNGSYRDRPLF